MGCLILTHLGQSIPPYMKDCVHQLRIWNPELTIYLILDTYHKENIFQTTYLANLNGEMPLWNILVTKYGVNIVYTDSLYITQHHSYFRNNLKSEERFDLQFRKGYWQFFKERFFYLEELIKQKSLTDVISMEYDILVYQNIQPLFQKLAKSHQTLRFVKDNETKGHPGFIYIPNYSILEHYNQFLVSIMDSGLEDMQSLVAYEKKYPTRVHYLPVLSEETTFRKPNRRSLEGHTTQNPSFLCEDASLFGCLFDSLAVGQWISGVDPRNTGGHKYTRYPNEGSLYTVEEVGLEWVQIESKWVPILDGMLLLTIHIHSKALSHFLSDRITCPADDYEVDDILKGLVPNQVP